MTKPLLVLFAVVMGVGTALAVEFPRHQAMFEGMIVRCDADGKCHWECEFGVVTSTTMVNENLVVKPSGCAPKNTATEVKGINFSPLQYGDTVYHSL